MLQKNSRQFGTILIVFTVTLAVAISSNSAKAFEVVSKGDNLIVACENITIHAESDAFSNIVGRLKFGNRVTAIGLAGLFHLSATDYSSKQVLEKRAQDEARQKDMEPEPVPAREYTRASWIQIGNGKYVSNSCLVSPENFKDQTIENSQKKVDQIASAKAKRGFSEDEASADMSAMRGASGKAKGGPADYEAIDRLIEAAQDKIDFAALKSFRRVGRLGEFR